MSNVPLDTMTLKGLAKYKQPFVGSYPDWAKKSHLFIITCIFLFVDVYNPEIKDSTACAGFSPVGDALLFDSRIRFENSIVEGMYLFQ